MSVRSTAHAAPGRPPLAERSRTRDRLPTVAAFAGPFLLILCVTLLYRDDDYLLGVLVSWLFLAISATSLNWLLGLSGIFSLAHAAFFGIGAYTSALLTMGPGWPFWPSVLAAVAVTAVAAVLIGIPSFRTGGIFFAIVTFGFGQIINVTIANWKDLTGGTQGLLVLEGPPAFLGLDFGGPDDYAVLLAALLGLLLVATVVVKRSGIGRRLHAIKDNPSLALAMGVDVRRDSVGVFAVSAAVAGLAGALYGPFLAFLHPDYFTMWVTVNAVVAVVIGGLGTVYGPVIGAAVVIALPEVFRFTAESRPLVVGSVTVLVILVAPQGLMTVGRWFRRTRGRDPGAGSPGHGPVPVRTAPRPENPVPRALIRPTRPGAHVIDVRGVSVNFAGLKALTDVSFTVEDGSILAVIGPNGAGKTTLFNVLTGFRAPDGGSILHRGEDVTGIKPWQASRTGILRTFQTPRTFPDMTVVEHLTLAAEVRRSGPGASPDDLDWITESLGLAPILAAHGSDLTHIDQKRLGIGMALCRRPDVLMLDEVASGLADSEKDELSALLVRLNAAGMTLMFVEHDLRFVAGLATAAVVLDAGRMIYNGSPDGLHSDRTVREAYLGVAADARD
jgi:branched-chain amino acid transport system ATP-binding protein